MDTDIGEEEALELLNEASLDTGSAWIDCGMFFVPGEVDGERVEFCFDLRRMDTITTKGDIKKPLFRAQ